MNESKNPDITHHIYLYSTAKIHHKVDQPRDEPSTEGAHLMCKRSSFQRFGGTTEKV